MNAYNKSVCLNIKTCYYLYGTNIMALVLNTKHNVKYKTQCIHNILKKYFQKMLTQCIHNILKNISKKC